MEWLKIIGTYGLRVKIGVIHSCISRFIVLNTVSVSDLWNLSISSSNLVFGHAIHDMIRLIVRSTPAAHGQKKDILSFLVCAGGFCFCLVLALCIVSHCVVRGKWKPQTLVVGSSTNEIHFFTNVWLCIYGEPCVI